ncbi:YqhA family protein [Campylobacter upsaliensis]|uniref:YqhA family protein n=1 Tax=Campylobacter upsaliensis TaxID=28080 RepID=UPI00126FEFFC|nr:YqhA family protein [Campylobacter upsaliensis]EAI8514150.1 YqhA family protein [Campylobacter upsaliensis]EAL0281622.1 YqhA family protein [Campylobacter upsaliensis]EHK6249514.1 YqhA family protein [Campylobacter upsaliensis]EHQ5392391.1 YqhA family protein [Campylobacter upsaliensis]MEB2791100.1 YqhA family protein [Campylobacter upsaliensis]
MLEKMFEGLLVKSRFVTILPVIFGLVGAFVLFFIASYDVLKVIFFTYQYFFASGVEIDLHEDVVGLIIGAVDLYLMALVLFIFSFGVYELFISEIEEFKQTKQSKVLEVHSLDQLKDKLAKVIIMVLVVNFFQRVLQMKFTTPVDMAYLAGSILALCVGLYFLHKGGH